MELLDLIRSNVARAVAQRPGPHEQAVYHVLDGERERPLCGARVMVARREGQAPGVMATRVPEALRCAAEGCAERWPRYFGIGR